MGQHNLDLILNLRHIVVVGASEKADTIVSALMKNFLEGVFRGRVLPVNPKYSNIHGLYYYRYVADLDVEMDLAIIAIPVQSVAEIVQEWVNREVGRAIILLAGGKETGGQDIEIDGKI